MECLSTRYYYKIEEELLIIKQKKKKTIQRHIFKIESSRLRREKWNIKNLSLKSARENEELVSIADSEVLRFIRDINNDPVIDERYKQIRKNINEVKRLKTNIENRRIIDELYGELDKLLFMKDYMMVVMSNNSDFDRANKGFTINGITFKRLLATTGGVKNNTVIYVNNAIYDELNKRLDNGRDMNKKLVPAKLEAYKALACSASIPISQTKRVIVVDDCVTHFKSDVIKLDDSKKTPPNLIHAKDCELELEDSDGFGLISPNLSGQWTEEMMGEEYISSGFCIRNSFCKGMLFTFDFHKFAMEVADNNFIKDIWGDIRDVRDADIILTGSMLKLHSSYNSMEHYLNCCEENGYSFSITEVIPKELENQRNLNYQFIQPLKLNDNDINSLIKPTVDDINDVLTNDYRKTLLFLKGIYLNEDTVFSQSPDFAQAMMVDKRMFDDPFVQRRVHGMIKKRINEAKVGVLFVKGNFSIISGDPYSLCQKMFGQEITGLLKSGEFYSAYWNERNINKVAAFRAPMTCHNNIRIFDLKNNHDMDNWYRYMNRCTILNSWDTTTHALNGADKDSDIILTTDNATILKGIEKKEAIVCVQKEVNPIIPTEEDLVKSNKMGFGDAIGSITNKITSMFAVQAQYKEGSPEYETLEKRIMWGQHYQQMAIDKIKGIVGAPMPSEWFSYYSNIINDEDDEDIRAKKQFNLNILADKKPYFMSYIYPQDMRKHKTYINQVNKNCIIDFGINLDSLRKKPDRSEEENMFLYYCDLKMPLNMYPSLMNKICYKIEDEFDDVVKRFNGKHDFDYSILKCQDTKYSLMNYNEIKKIYRIYTNNVKRHMANLNKEKNNEDAMTNSEARTMFQQRFKREALRVCSDEKELCNIVLDLCYPHNKSKQFAWDLCGGVIIENLLKLNNYQITYPQMDKDGDIEFSGQKFKMVEVNVKEDYK